MRILRLVMVRAFRMVDVRILRFVVVRAFRLVDVRILRFVVVRAFRPVDVRILRLVVVRAFRAMDVRILRLVVVRAFRLVDVRILRFVVVRAFRPRFPATREQISPKTGIGHFEDVHATPGCQRKSKLLIRSGKSQICVGFRRILTDRNRRSGFSETTPRATGIVGSGWRG